ncbi:hypothetical protein OOK60_12665 [Trichothermofontia sichuanensis B231]|uniref:hypothetical protein n=1 Tax=Trichothermofontia sichuanensis TaxID=3045816 RepID=UPI002247E8DB|nr:hypothetical protein [Trichothermofontia sichuanensis]UZQ53354.1 hypothetical protein OOK60_12665 [Trichothermofontia sichuanensis B231]
MTSACNSFRIAIDVLYAIYVYYIIEQCPIAPTPSHLTASRSPRLAQFPGAIATGGVRGAKM